MANTIIQVKRSTTTATPTNGSLSAGEPAYSYSSNVMFIGTSDAAGVLPIGGQFYVNKTNSAYDIAVAAFGAANSAGSSEGMANIYNQANAAYDKANSANVLAYNSGVIASAGFDKANSANVLAYNSGVIASAGFDKANSANVLAYNSGIIASAGFDKANSANVLAYNSGIIASGAFDKANSANVLGYNSGIIASAGFDKANSANVLGYNSGVIASAAYDKANSANVLAYNTEIIAIAAFASSNNKFSSSGGTITGDVTIVGNLSFSGNTSFTNVSTYVVNDPLIYLANNNYTSDIVDIGFIANYVNATGSNVHTGLYREHTDKEYYLFQGYDKEPVDNHIGALSNNMTLAVLNADIKTSNLILGGQNTITWITSAYDRANVSLSVANAAYSYANTVGGIANAAYDKANSANVLAYESGIIASGAYDKANSANVLAYNSGIIASGAFDKANSANVLAYNSGIIASAAFDKANTANVNAADASFLTTGIVSVGVGGTGVTSFTSNGIVFGNGSGALNVTSAGTEGQVLQAGATGVPSFGMLDGGTF